MWRLVLETAIGPVLPLSDGKDREARWDWAAATGGVTQDPPCSRAARQGPATTQWRSAAEPNVQPGWLVKPLPRRGAWRGPAAPTSQRSRLPAAQLRWWVRWSRLCHWLPSPVTFRADGAGRPDQAGGQHFQPASCSAFTATASACWRPWRPTGRTSSCRSRRRSSRWCNRSAAAHGRCVERFAQPMLSTTTAQPLPGA